MAEQPERIFSVDEVNTRLQAIIHKDTVGNRFWTGGIVKNVHAANSGHIYFNLIDDPFSIRCMISHVLRGELPFAVSNNIEVEVFGEIRFYDKRATVEISVQKIRLIESALIPPNPQDVNDYFRKRGLADLATYEKKAIPSEVKRIFLLTSASSKALDDFKHTYNRKSNPANAAQIIHEDIPLEGEHAPQQIAEVIQRVNAMRQPGDIMVLTRGGGRKAALATFNDFLIAEAIHRSETPIITGIGHQKDNVLADMLADNAAITPTDAANILIEAQQKKTPCAPIFILLITLLSLASSLVLLSMMFMIEI